jgi:hypothetical protein
LLRVPVELNAAAQLQVPAMQQPRLQAPGVSCTVFGGRTSRLRQFCAKLHWEDPMTFVPRLFFAGFAVAACAAVAPAQQMTLDPAAIAFKLPNEIVWKDNPSGNRTALLQGDPSKPGPYAMLLTWLPNKMSRPHYHPNDRFFMVISGTWWMGTGPEFKPEATVPAPAGSHVIHYAKGVHYDGAKDEPVTILVWGEGPATATPFGK